MGFLSSVGNAVKAVAKAAVEKNREAKELALEWESQSDTFLARKYKNGSTTEKMAALKAFRERYPDDEIRREAVRDAVRNA